MSRAATVACGLAVVLAAAACGSGNDGDGTGDTTTTRAPLEAITTTTLAGGAELGEDPCVVLTEEEIEVVTGLDVTVTSEPRGQDLACVIADPEGTTVAELQVTIPENVETVIAGAAANPGGDVTAVDGIGEGLAVAALGTQAYLLVGDAGYVWTTFEPGIVTYDQLVELMRSVVAG